MAASITDLLRRGAPAFSTTLSAQKGAGAASASLSSSTGIPTTTAIEICVGRVDANGTKTPALKAIYKGILSGTTVSSLTLLEGTDQLHAAGTPVEIIFSAAQWNNLIDWAITQHNTDGTHGAITATSLSATGVVNASAVSSLQDASTALSTYRTDYTFDFVQSGLVWSGLGYGSTLTAAMTSGVCYINGQRLAISSVATRTFTASKDTYIDILNTAGVGSIVYTEVANNAASPALVANSLRIGIVVTGANIAAATSINQGQETMVLPIASSIPYAVTDSLGNLICPRDPQRRVIGYRQIVSTFTTTSTTDTQLTGLSAVVTVPTNRKVKLTAYVGQASNNTSANNIVLSIWDGVVNSGTRLNYAVVQPQLGSLPNFITAQAITSPATGTKTYNVGISTTGVTTTSVIVSATSPAYLVVELV